MIATSFWFLGHFMVKIPFNWRTRLFIFLSLVLMNEQMFTRVVKYMHQTRFNI